MDNRFAVTRGVAVLLLAALVACDPSDRRPGLWLTGEEAPFAEDWSFTAEIPEIALEVSTPYLVPHSVTIWCASLDGTLYVGASNPDSKRWPGWVDDDPDVRLGIAGKIYAGRLEALEDAAVTERLRAVYAQKYRLEGGGGQMATVRYWRVRPRA